MRQIRSLALRVPALRRLVDHRDRLRAELEAAQTALQAAASDLQMERSALQTADAALRAERAARETLDRVTKPLRQARDESRLLVTDYAYFPVARPIDRAAGGRQIEELFRRSESSIATTIAGIARHADALARIPRCQEDPARPHWENDWFPPFDGAALYGLIAERQPRLYLEVGSGISTRFARQAVSDLGLATRIVSIDPEPRGAVSDLCDETIVQRMEDVPGSYWEGLAAGDMLFIDNSHRSFPGSDVTVFFSEVMPALPPGVIYGIHDIFLPCDYPSAWDERFYNEQYLLMAYLLGGNGGDEVLLPVHWAVKLPQLHGLLSPLWDNASLFDGIGTGGGAYWARRGGPGPPTSPH
ncbi:class I SAM-dependent methyltransferase [Roseomonas terrae]|uniref:Class I SAM-dependent methyltransferase n=1 Tax=Neoroseomonas terrae TaxID=424799 RepID=A0ABS5EPU5_9PROT|nr:class I SAM-dependent methyltransferase [Neoroseomonas terrae]MBR0653039.1 class I SAM-dependent methyltransferase [Neoroseomonas terrae]